MNIYIFCGKGGVGKTNSAVSLGVYLASMDRRTAIIDYDGGHSVKSTLGVSQAIPPNTITQVKNNLHVVVVENTDFTSVASFKERNEPLDEYFKQFPDDYGIIPLADMVNAFFGVPTDVPALQKFITLVVMLEELRDKGFSQVIIDVEPTAGLERLLSNANATVRSLRNLENQGKVSLAMLGVKWPDIAKYLRGDYIKNASRYCLRIERTVMIIQAATYLLVCTPEIGPVNQTFEVRRIIEKFGGTVRGYIVNNIRGESFEQENIARLSESNLPITKIHRDNGLHMFGNHRMMLLHQIGDTIARSL